MYDIVFTKRGADDYKKLERLTRKRVNALLMRCNINPLKYFKKLHNTDAFRARVGNYRIIASIDTKKKVLAVLRIAHRKKIYKIFK